MNIIQPGEIRLLIRKLRLPEIVPHPATGSVVAPINPPGGAGVKHTQHLRQAGGYIRIARRMSDEVIMIGKDRPSFESPREVSCDDEKPTV
jgi:hypothetical protein